MIARIATIVSIFAFAFVILVVSVLRSAAVRYAFSQSPSPTPQGAPIEINYEFAYPGRILPNHPLWGLKVVRDKAWLVVTTNPLKKAEILLLLADKRLGSAQILFDKNEAEVGVSTLTKAEGYLEQAVNQEKVAREKGSETNQLLLNLANSELKHRQVLEEILSIAPEDAKPFIVEAIDYPKMLFEQTKVSLEQMGSPIPKNPFEE